VYVVLILASLFVLSGCGIPNYLNLDNEITWQTVTTETDVHKTDQVRIAVNSAGLTEIQEKVDAGQGPGLKLFYSLSNSPSAYDFPFDITTRFYTYMKGGTSGTGKYWTLESPQRAPGFFLFKPTSTSELNPLVVVRPSLSQVDVAASSVIVGTFSIASTSDNHSGSFRDGSNMDIPLNRTTGTIDIMISGMDTNSDGNIELIIEYGDNLNLTTTEYLLDYQNSQFPLGASQIAPYSNNLKNDANDSIYWEHLDPSKDLYLHVWVSLYGGAGFTNIYWSPLKYLGSINLF
jgi:hypothetical protein